MFSSSFRQAWMKRYEKYGTFRKILILLIMTMLTAGSIICAVWSIGLYSDNVVLGIVTSIVFIALAVVDFEFCMLYSMTAFRMARHGTVSLMKKKEEPKPEETEIPESEASEKVNNSAEQKPKKNKILDYMIGFLGVIFGLGVIVVLVVLIYTAIKR